MQSSPRTGGWFLVRVQVWQQMPRIHNGCVLVLHTSLDGSILSRGTMEDKEKLREEVIKKWKESGLLDGLKGPLKQNIAELYECCKTSKIEEGKFQIPLAKQVSDKLK